MTFFITWNSDPEIFHIGSLSIRWYGVLFALSFGIGYFIISRFFKKENIPIKLVDELTTYMVIGTVIGARLGHCLFYEPDWYLSHPIEILKVWEGGLASHGAAVGILLAIFIFSKKIKRNFLWLMDRVVIPVALAGFFIRTGNLINSEIIGKPSDLPWAFLFINASNPQFAIDPRHPTQIYEALSYLLIFIFLLFYYYKKNGSPKEGKIFGMFMVFVFGVRILIEFVKEPQVGFENTMLLNMGQLLSIPFILLGLILIFRKGK
ncbi:MAG: prolipoprotein diacylglyceryl transferase [Bacteroidales bacterium]|nr:prolipoprotein diacylglyceryl transferase [Bacteroidales bacterium]